MPKETIKSRDKTCIDSAMRSTVALDGVNDHRLIVTNIMGTAYAQFGNVLVLAATAYEYSCQGLTFSKRRSYDTPSRHTSGSYNHETWPYNLARRMVRQLTLFDIPAGMGSLFDVAFLTSKVAHVLLVLVFACTSQMSQTSHDFTSDINHCF